MLTHRQLHFLLDLLLFRLQFGDNVDLNEQAQERYRLIIRQMMENEGVNENLKQRSQWEWVKAMNSIVSRAEEIIRSEMCNA